MAKFHEVDIENVHQSFIANAKVAYVRYCNFMQKEQKSKAITAAIVSDVVKDYDKAEGMPVKVISQFEISSSALYLIDYWAKFSYIEVHELSFIDEKENIREIDTIGTFEFDKLLTCSYPINHGIFRANDCTHICIMEDCSELQNDLLFVPAFTGLGILLMEELRKTMPPLLSDEEIIAASRQYYLAIY